METRPAREHDILPLDGRSAVMNYRRVEVTERDDGTRCICSNDKGSLFVTGHLRYSDLEGSYA